MKRRKQTKNANAGKPKKRPQETTAAKPPYKTADKTSGGNGHRLWWLAVCLFFASGLCGLVYQVLWMHQLVLVFGGTTLATSTVLGVFMGGLALGSFLAGKFADRTPYPFLWYGLLEGIIGIWAVFAPFMFDMATPLYQVVHLIVPNDVVLTLLRVYVACVVLLPPTTCMGATLPLLSKMVTARLEIIGDRIGLLYSVNTIGAVVGTALAGFVLIPLFGLVFTNSCAAVTNIALSLVALYVQRKYLAGKGDESTSADASLPTAGGDAKLPREVMIVLVLFGFAGGVSMIYEVAWTRLLLMVIGSTTYAFSVMLAAFLLGIVLGSYVCSRFVDRAKNAIVYLAILELFVGLATFAGLSLFGMLPYWNMQLGAQWYQNQSATIAIRFLMAGAILMPLTFFIGATFPAAVKACTTQLERVGRSVGTVYSANTLGAIFGALLAGFLLVPYLGAEKTLAASAAANVAIGAVLLAQVADVRYPVKILVVALAVFLACVIDRLPPFWNRLAMILGQVERRAVSNQKGISREKSYADWIDRLGSCYQLEFYKDGACSSVAIMYNIPFRQYMLLTNGHVDATTKGDMGVQELVSYFPFWCCPDAKQVAVIGWGSGVSVGDAATFPIEQIDAVELEPAVIEASKYFHDVNHQPDHDPRVNIIVNDGRNYLMTSPKMYDLIISEPSNPWQAGVCNLFTREYFAICRQRLNVGGVLSLWLQVGELSPTAIKQIMSALALEFPNTLTFRTDSGNLVILASERPIKIDCRSVEASLHNKIQQEDLRRLDMTGLEHVLCRITMNDQGLRALCKNVTPNSDNRNRVEYEVAKTYESTFYNKENNDMLSSQAADFSSNVEWPALTATEMSGLKARIAENAELSDNLKVAPKWEAAALAFGTSADTLSMRAFLERNGDFSKAQSDWQEALRLEPNNTQIRLMWARQLVERGLIDEACSEYQKILAVDPEVDFARQALAQLYMPSAVVGGHKGGKDDPTKALGFIEPLLNKKEAIERRPSILFLASLIYYRLGDYEQAHKMCSRYQGLTEATKESSQFMKVIESHLKH